MHSPCSRRGKARPPPPVRATFDNWAIDACPHHGPGITPAAGGGYHAVWFGERAAGVTQVQAQVSYGRLQAKDGKPSGEVLALPDERAEHADILSAGPQAGDRLAQFRRAGHRVARVDLK